MGLLSIAAGAQQNSDNSARKQTIYHANVVYAFSKAKIYAGYLRSKDDTGFVDSLLAQQTIPVAKGTGRIDDGPFAGVSWQVSAPLTLTGAFYYDHMRNAMTTNGTLASGNRYAIVGIAEYALSTGLRHRRLQQDERRGERRAAGSQQPDRHRDRPAQYLLTNVGTHRPAVVRLHRRAPRGASFFVTRPSYAHTTIRRMLHHETPRRKGFVGNPEHTFTVRAKPFRYAACIARSVPPGARVRRSGCARRVRPASA